MISNLITFTISFFTDQIYVSLHAVQKAKLSIQEIIMDVIPINQIQTIKITHPKELENCTFVLYIDMRKYGIGVERTLPIFCDAVSMTEDEIFGRNNVPLGSKSGQSMQYKLENLAGFTALNITGKIFKSAYQLLFSSINYIQHRILRFYFIA